MPTEYTKREKIKELEKMQRGEAFNADILNAPLKKVGSPVGTLSGALNTQAPSNPPASPPLMEKLKPQTPSQDAATLSPVESEIPPVPTPEQKQDEKEIKSTVASLTPDPKGVKQFDVEKSTKDLLALSHKYSPGGQEYESTMAPIAERLTDLNNRIAEVSKGREDEVNRSDWGQVAEQIGNALTMFGAGLYGAKHGVDLTGAKFSKTDWEARLKNRLDNINQQVNELHSQRGMVNEEGKEARQGLRQTAGEIGRVQYEGEKQNVETAREMAKTQMNNDSAMRVAQMHAGATIQAAQIHANATTAKHAQALENKMSQLDQHQAEQALKALNAKHMENQKTSKGFDSAITQLGLMDAEDIDDKKLQVMWGDFRRGLTAAGLNETDLPKVSRAFTSPSTWFNAGTLDKEKAITTLKAMKANLQPAFDTVDKAHAAAYQKVTGQARPDSSQTVSTNTLQPGTIKNGYRFNGGDPADKNNWAPIQ